MNTIVHKAHFDGPFTVGVEKPTCRVAKAQGAMEKIVRGWVIQLACQRAIELGVNVKRITRDSEAFAENVLVDLAWPFDAEEIERRIEADLQEKRGSSR